MKKLQLLLSYYSIIASTSLLIWALLISPSPQNLILAILFLPCGLYFCLTAMKIFEKTHLFEDSKNADSHKTWQIIFLALIVSSLSFLLYAGIAAKAQKSPDQTLTALSEEVKSLKSQPRNQNIEKELQDIKKSLTYLTAQKTPPPESQIKSVTLKDPKTTSVNIYQDKSLDSKIISQAEFGKIYPYLDKDANWYHIFVASGENGYIESSLVKETIF